MLTTTDVAYVIAIIEKAPSVYPRRRQIIDDLQRAWKASSDKGQPWHMPVAPGEITICAQEEYHP